METVQMEKKSKELSTLEAQERMYKDRMKEYQWNQGLSIQEMLDKVNDPRSYRRSHES